MSEPVWMNEVHSVEQLRDELRLKAHLLREDGRAEWEKLEHQWAEFERDLRVVRHAVDVTAREVETSARAMLEALRRGYGRIREALPPREA